MSICSVLCIALDERSRYDNDVYYRVVEHNHVYLIIESLKTHVLRRIEYNDFYLKFVKCVDVVEVNDTYDFNGLGESGMSLYDDPYTLYNWRQSGNVVGFDINGLLISSFGGSEALYNVPYISGELNRGLGNYFSAATGKFHTITADFMVPDGMSTVTISVNTYNAWNRFTAGTPRWAGVVYYIDSDTTNRQQCEVTNEGELVSQVWYTHETSLSVCDTSKAFTVTPGQHSLTFYLGLTSSYKPTPPSGYNDSQYRNVNMAIDSIKLEFS